MRVMEAKIDCANRTLSSKMFKKPVSLQLTNKGLFLIDVNQLVRAAQDNLSPSLKCQQMTTAETFVSDGQAKKKVSWGSAAKVIGKVSDAVQSQSHAMSMSKDCVKHVDANFEEPDGKETILKSHQQLDDVEDRQAEHAMCRQAQSPSTDLRTEKHPKQTVHHVAQPAPAPSARASSEHRNAESQSLDSRICLRRS